VLVASPQFAVPTVVITAFKPRTGSIKREWVK